MHWSLILHIFKISVTLFQVGPFFNISLAIKAKFGLFLFVVWPSFMLWNRSSQPQNNQIEHLNLLPMCQFRSFATIATQLKSTDHLKVWVSAEIGKNKFLLCYREDVKNSLLMVRLTVRGDGRGSATSPFGISKCEHFDPLKKGFKQFCGPRHACFFAQKIIT